ncbi:MAG: hypothetical protein A2284_03600 [Deltaproteobacteria bacterium RIFOXYA12_FULL_61_11]|nr:MAG: hypothetical protein A2284_03600 [Deltaproteobacteria bacterium RIFOXYA12_FULL_61_11]
MAVVTQLGSSKRGDPSLLIKLCNKKRVFLFDCGESNFTASQLKQVDVVLISHAHVDHFIGFDRLLRVNLTDAKDILVLGPPGIVENVEGKLRGYTWNITEKLHLRLFVAALYHEDSRVYRFDSVEGFVRHPTDRLIDSRQPLEDDDLTITTAALDHKIPSIAYCLLEKQFYNVRKDSLERLGFGPGPWLGELKRRVGSGEDLSGTLQVHERTFTLGELKRELLLPKQRFKIVYVTDVIYAPENRAKIVELARDAELFFCEAYFRKEDEERARNAFHLTTEQAGFLAAEAGVHRLVPIHISKRYQNVADVLAEIATVFERI